MEVKWIFVNEFEIHKNKSTQKTIHAKINFELLLKAFTVFI